MKRFKWFLETVENRKLFKATYSFPDTQQPQLKLMVSLSTSHIKQFAVFWHI